MASLRPSGAIGRFGGSSNACSGAAEGDKGPGPLCPGFICAEQVVEEERRRSGAIPVPDLPTQGGRNDPSPFLGFLAGHNRPTDGLGVGVTIDRVTIALSLYLPRNLCIHRKPPLS